MNAKMRAKLETYLLSRRHLAHSTTDKILRYVRILERAGVDPRRPSRARYDAFIAQRRREGRDGPGLRHYGRAMRHILAWRGIHWPDFELPPPLVSPRRLLPDSALHALLEYDQDEDGPLVRDTLRACFRMIFYLTLRPPSELHDLDVRDANLDHGTLRVWCEKTGRHETTHMRAWETDIFRDYMRTTRRQVLDATHSHRRGPPSSRLVLNPRTGTAFSREALRMFLARAIKRVDETARGYDLRHAGATYIMVQTRDIDFVARRLRHTPGSPNTRTYIHLADEAERDKLHDLRPFTGMTSPTTTGSEA